MLNSECGSHKPDNLSNLVASICLMKNDVIFPVIKKTLSDIYRRNATDDEIHSVFMGWFANKSYGCQTPNTTFALSARSLEDLDSRCSPGIRETPSTSQQLNIPTASEAPVKDDVHSSIEIEEDVVTKSITIKTDESTPRTPITYHGSPAPDDSEMKYTEYAEKIENSRKFESKTNNDDGLQPFEVVLRSYVNGRRTFSAILTADVKLESEIRLESHAYVQWVNDMDYGRRLSAVIPFSELTLGLAILVEDNESLAHRAIVTWCSDDIALVYYVDVGIVKQITVETNSGLIYRIPTFIAEYPKLAIKCDFGLSPEEYDRSVTTIKSYLQLDNNDKPKSHIVYSVLIGRFNAEREIYTVDILEKSKDTSNSLLNTLLQDGYITENESRQAYASSQSTIALNDEDPHEHMDLTQKEQLEEDSPSAHSSSFFETTQNSSNAGAHPNIEPEDCVVEEDYINDFIQADDGTEDEEEEKDDEEEEETIVEPHAEKKSRWADDDSSTCSSSTTERYDRTPSISSNGGSKHTDIDLEVDESVLNGGFETELDECNNRNSTPHGSSRETIGDQSGSGSNYSLATAINDMPHEQESTLEIREFTEVPNDKNSSVGKVLLLVPSSERSIPELISSSVVRQKIVSSTSTSTVNDLITKAEKISIDEFSEKLKDDASHESRTSSQSHPTYAKDSALTSEGYKMRCLSPASPISNSMKSTSIVSTTNSNGLKRSSKNKSGFPAVNLSFKPISSKESSSLQPEKLSSSDPKLASSSANVKNNSNLNKNGGSSNSSIKNDKAVVGMENLEARNAAVSASVPVLASHVPLSHIPIKEGKPLEKVRTHAMEVNTHQSLPMGTGQYPVIYTPNEPCKAANGPVSLATFRHTSEDTLKFMNTKYSGAGVVGAIRDESGKSINCVMMIPEKKSQHNVDSTDEDSSNEEKDAAFVSPPLKKMPEAHIPDQIRKQWFKSGLEPLEVENRSIEYLYKKREHVLNSL